MKKLIILLSILILCSPSFAAIQTSFVGPGTDWMDPANWDNGIPDIGDNILMKADSEVSYGDAAIRFMKMNTNGADVLISGGTMTADNFISVGFDATNTFAMTGGTLYFDSDAGFKIGDKTTAGNGTVDLSGTARVDSEYITKLGWDGIGSVYMADDALWTNAGSFRIGNNLGSDGYLEMNGGELRLEGEGGSDDTLDGSLFVGMASYGDVKVNDGVIFAPDLYVGAYGSIDITGGYISVNYDGASGETWEDFKSRIMGYGITQNDGDEAATYFVDDANTKMVIAPEPATVALFGMGLVFFRRKRK